MLSEPLSWPVDQSSLLWSFIKSNLISIIFSSGLAYFIGSCIYSVYFSPLSKFPGPKIAAVTRFSYWHALFTGNQVRWVQTLHRQYGPVVRFGPRDLSYIDSQAWKDICGHISGENRATNLKDKLFFGPPKNGVESMITATDAEHAKVRRILSAAFSERALKQQEPLFLKYVDLLLEKLRATIAKDLDTHFDMVKMFNFTTFDIMGDLTFGEPLGLLENSHYTPWVELIFKSISVLPYVQMTEHYPWLKKIYNALEPKSLRHLRVSHFKHSTERVDKRLKLGSDRPDIWNLVVSANGNRALTVEEMHSNAEIFMTAGTETTATALSGLSYYLLKNPHTMQKLVDEIRGSFQSEDELTLERLSSLKYLHACIEESIRMYPPVPSALPRRTPKGGNTILGQWVPGNVSVSVNQFSTYHSPTNFKNPDTFVPERWLGDPEYAGDNRAAFQPFSVGPRNCLGQKTWPIMRYA